MVIRIRDQRRGFSRGERVAEAGQQRDRQVAGRHDVRFDVVVDRRGPLGAVRGDQVVRTGGRPLIFHRTYRDHEGIIAGAVTVP